jgi:spore coat protein U-like protein
MCFFPALVQGQQCTLSTIGVAFGNYNPLSSVNGTSTGTITAYCNANISVNIIIGASANSGGFNPRKMCGASGVDLLSYNLYTNSSRTGIWGDGTQGSSTVSIRINKNMSSDAIIYASTPGSQNVGVGQYADFLVATINF